MNYKVIIMLSLVLFVSCNRDKKSDAYGNFSADEIIISSESNGKIISINFKEGDNIKIGDTIAIIDNTILELKKNQLIAQKKAISTKFNNIIAQVNVLAEQKDVLEIEKQRLESLLQDSAISKQKYDNLIGQININNEKIKATKSGNSSIFGELETIDASMKLIEEQITRCNIISPIDGVVLEKYINNFELAVVGKPIFKIANMKTMELTVYVSENQLSNIQIGQKADVITDNQQDLNLEGTVKWISSTAEFTPKIIQTKKERVNLVYAVKLDVENNGSLKIGMPAEVNFK